MFAFTSALPVGQPKSGFPHLPQLGRPGRALNSFPHASPNPTSPPFCRLSSVSTQTVKQNRLGNSNLMVSEVCIGTMTWGLQNTEQQAHQLLDYAISRGVKFLDTAETYPFPANAPGWKPGRSEEHIGRYLAKHPQIRSNLIIATKVSGFSPSSPAVANRHPDRTYDTANLPTARLDTQSIQEACDASLRRLCTDYIDLYQVHWPDRYVPIFGGRRYKPENERDSIPIRETLMGLKKLLDDGKIRAYGLSNETTFGVCEYVRLADELGMPRPASVQNAFCLLNRSFEWELAEACSPLNYNIGLLPWSILGGGALTGKYNGKLDADRNTGDDSLNSSRFVTFKDLMPRFSTDTALDLTAKYQRLAEDNGMSVATLAQAFCKSQWYIPSSIVGATRLEQLEENIDAFHVELSEDVLAAIDELHNSNKDVHLSS